MQLLNFENHTKPKCVHTSQQEKRNRQMLRNKKQIRVKYKNTSTGQSLITSEIWNDKMEWNIEIE